MCIIRKSHYLNTIHTTIAMKKFLLISLSALLLTACSEEKKQFVQAVSEQMQNDQDIKDYDLDPEKMTECVVDLVTQKMPGLFPFDPRRQPYYVGYSKLISVKQSENPKQSLLEVQEAFGSKKATMQALMNYSESVMTCVTALVSESYEDLQ